MAQENGKIYSLKERYNYHKKLADKGRDENGQLLTTTQRVYHANKAMEIAKEQNTFMKGVEFANKNYKKTGKKYSSKF